MFESSIFNGVFSNSVLFASNGFFQRHLLLDSVPHAHQLDRVALAGSLSGVVMAVVNCPVELLKVRLQVQDHKIKVKHFRENTTYLFVRNTRIFLIAHLKLSNLME